MGGDVEIFNLIFHRFLRPLFIIYRVLFKLNRNYLVMFSVLVNNDNDNNNNNKAEQINDINN